MKKFFLQFFSVFMLLKPSFAQAADWGALILPSSIAARLILPQQKLPDRQKLVEEVSKQEGTLESVKSYIDRFPDLCYEVTKDDEGYLLKIDIVPTYAERIKKILLLAGGIQSGYYAAGVGAAVGFILGVNIPVEYASFVTTPVGFLCGGAAGLAIGGFIYEKLLNLSQFEPIVLRFNNHLSFVKISPLKDTY